MEGFPLGVQEEELLVDCVQLHLRVGNLRECGVLVHGGCPPPFTRRAY